MPDQPLSAQCICTVSPPRREHAHGSSYGRAVYVDEVHDDTRFDPACPFHGEGGSMVVRIGGALDQQQHVPERSSEEGR